MIEATLARQCPRFPLRALPEGTPDRSRRAPIPVITAVSSLGSKFTLQLARCMPMSEA
jgi:hypothetical protein